MTPDVEHRLKMSRRFNYYLRSADRLLLTILSFPRFMPEQGIKNHEKNDFLKVP